MSKEKGKIALTAALAAIAAIAAIAGGSGVSTLDTSEVIEIPTNAKIGYVMQNLDKNEQKSFKARLLADQKIEKFKRDEIDIEIKKIEASGEIIYVYVDAKVDGKKLKDVKRYGFVNPDYIVQDGEGFREDPEEWIRQEITKAIKLQNNL